MIHYAIAKERFFNNHLGFCIITHTFLCYHGTINLICGIAIDSWLNVISLLQRVSTFMSVTLSLFVGSSILGKKPAFFATLSRFSLILITRPVRPASSTFFLVQNEKRVRGKLCALGNWDAARLALSKKHYFACCARRALCDNDPLLAQRGKDGSSHFHFLTATGGGGWIWQPLHLLINYFLCVCVCVDARAGNPSETARYSRSAFGKKRKVCGRFLPRRDHWASTFSFDVWERVSIMRHWIISAG